MLHSQKSAGLFTKDHHEKCKCGALEWFHIPTAGLSLTRSLLWVLLRHTLWLPTPPTSEAWVNSCWQLPTSFAEGWTKGLDYDFVFDAWLFFFFLLCLEKIHSSGTLSVLQIQLLHPCGSSILSYDFIIPSLELELRKKRARCLTLKLWPSELFCPSVLKSSVWVQGEEVCAEEREAVSAAEAGGAEVGSW